MQQKNRRRKLKVYFMYKNVDLWSPIPNFEDRRSTDLQQDASQNESLISGMHYVKNQSNLSIVLPIFINRSLGDGNWRHPTQSATNDNHNSELWLRK